MKISRAKSVTGIARRRAAVALAVALGLDDAHGADALGFNRREFMCVRLRAKLPNGLGWPISSNKLSHLLTVEKLTDREIAARYSVGRRTVEQARIELLGLYRDHDCRPSARRKLLTRKERFGRASECFNAEATPLDQALRRLGGRVGRRPDGGYMLDGKPVTVQAVLSAAG